MNKKPLSPTYPLSILVVEGIITISSPFPFVIIQYNGVLNTSNIIIDNEINQKVVKRVFTHLGYQEGTLAMVDNGLEALNYIGIHPMPDIILMDIQMYLLLFNYYY